MGPAFTTNSLFQNKLAVFICRKTCRQWESKLARFAISHRQAQLLSRAHIACHGEVRLSRWSGWRRILPPSETWRALCRLNRLENSLLGSIGRFSHLALMVMPSLEAVLSEVSRVLRLGGTFAAVIEESRITTRPTISFSSRW